MRPSLVEHLLAFCDRLVVGSYNEETEEPVLEREVESWGFEIAGRSEVLHSDLRVVRRVFWLDR